MAGNDSNAATASGSAAAGNEGSKKLAGKYENADAGVEALDRGMTEGFHSIKEELAAMRELFTQVGSRGNADYSDQGYNRGNANNGGEDADSDLNAADLLANPGKVLSAREKRMILQSRRESAALAANLVANATTVVRFQMKNPDLDEHEELVTMMMSRTDPREPLAKRLNQAGKLTRDYLKKLGKDAGGDEGNRGAGRQADADEEVESPNKDARGQEASRRAAGDKKDETQTSDEELAAELAERKARRSRNFGVGVSTKKE